MEKEISSYIKEISLEEIKSYKIPYIFNHPKENGGFYMMIDNEFNKAYIGKSQDVYARLKQHYILSIRAKGLHVDKVMHNRHDGFTFLFLESYLNLGIDYYTKKLETVYEHTLIGKYKTYHPFGYNMRYYEQLRIK